MTLETIKIYLSNPWFWIYFVTPILIIVLLPYIRKLYSKEMQESIIECEKSRKNPNEIDLKIKKKINKLGIFIFTLSLILFSIILIIFSSKSLSTYNFKDFLNYFATVMFVSMGIYYLYKNFFLQRILTQDEYEHHILEQEEQCLKSEFKFSQKMILFIKKYEKQFGIFFILFGIIGYFSNLILLK